MAAAEEEQEALVEEQVPVEVDQLILTCVRVGI